jgi:hypothetical protein
MQKLGVLTVLGRERQSREKQHRKEEKENSGRQSVFPSSHSERELECCG